MVVIFWKWSVSVSVRLTALPAVSASPENHEAIVEGMLWVGGIVVAFALAVVVLSCVKKRLEARPKPTEAVFGLDELREMKDKGELTTEQYEALRQRTIDTFRKGLDGKN